MEFDLFSGEKRFNLDGPDNRSTWSDECRIIYRNKRLLRGTVVNNSPGLICLSGEN